ncbi:DNA mismatch repair protein MutS [Alkalicoccus urumqiensis]|uniref:DNA mismatch repair protein MutS n=1 Tax=Alkalicoccus urumqiensis TaxID=1548213 RepID=A0A2P6MFY3_ALKUR|nr:DNA mismatch repair protein MutS [Alkalicoccus urumqiensis]PRO65161.1 DNA mismatch repair protein MutS [Alkalicoccus urumqiensis]
MAQAQATPMMKQYKEIKAQHEDAFLFFRLGDFYELFHEDALLAAKELEITLTQRGKGDDGVPMCGVPHHSSEQYISRLIDLGYKVAVCEQVENPQEAKGVVKREVVQVITPGTVMNGKAVREEANQFAVSIAEQNGTWSVSAADLTTGEWSACELESAEEAVNEALSYEPKEIIVAADTETVLKQALSARTSAAVSAYELEEQGEEVLFQDLSTPVLKRSAGMLLHYFHETTKRDLAHLQTVKPYEAAQYLQLDHHSKRNLEITESLMERTKKGSLLSVIDRTGTAMGARKLKRWLERPSLNKKQIEKRHGLTGKFIEHFMERKELQELLKQVYDLERLSGRVAFGTVNGRDLVQLKKSLQQMPGITALLKPLGNSYADELLPLLDAPAGLVELLDASIKEDCPVSVTEGGLICDGYNEQLDEYRDAMTNGRSWIAGLETEERQKTGIRSLKIGYNKVFGYYIEVSRPNLHLLQEGRYERKQTLSNAERFITPELKEKEAVILEAEEKSGELEYQLFTEVRDQVKQHIRLIQQIAESVSILDVLQGFAETAEERQYTKPVLTTDKKVEITESRHPVVETMADDGSYVPNSITLHKDREMLLITGPNMAGKSTYMRQLALSVILCQAGSYVPADSCEMMVFDKIFTRIGAADDLAQGQSTFMVEMSETRRAVEGAGEKSLILLDEIGRGTSTYDGMSLAQAVVEYIHDHLKAMTLFSTHYHELTALEKSLDNLVNVHVSAVEENGELTFLHRVVDGAADRSYGIHVARLARLPEALIRRADELLSAHESESAVRTEKKEKQPDYQEAVQIPLFPEEDPASAVVEELKQADILNMTPIQAMQFLDELRRKASREEKP